MTARRWPFGDQRWEVAGMELGKPAAGLSDETDDGPVPTFPLAGEVPWVMIVVGPGVQVDWKGADLDRFKIPRNFQWQGGGGGAGGPLRLHLPRPSHLVTKDKQGRIKVVAYHPDTSLCAKP